MSRHETSTGLTIHWDAEDPLTYRVKDLGHGTIFVTLTIGLHEVSVFIPNDVKSLKRMKETLLDAGADVADIQFDREQEEYGVVKL
jgi:hypothetical protein